MQSFEVDKQERSAYEWKKQKLYSRMEELGRENLVLAFSGGVDSSLLLKLAAEAAKTHGTRVYGILLSTMLHPKGEAEEARRVAEEIDVEFLVLSIDELNGAGIEKNPVDRCYLCKKHLFQKLREKAEGLGVSVILEGTNADDLKVYRPGIRAVKELGILSPLADAGFTKDEVRKLAAELGLSVNQKPSTPCLATRFPYGTTLSYEELEKVGKAEEYLRGLGFYNVRVRVHGEIVRVEVDRSEIPILFSYSGEMISRFKKLGYTYITLDLEGFRSGSMDVSMY